MQDAGKPKKGRREFLKLMAGCATSMALSPLVSSGRLYGQAPPRQPNVLLIAIDDLNDWVGCMGGHPDVKTPNMDRLAQRGVLFTNAHCSAPLCNPSRASFLTGIRPSTSGVYNNRQDMRSVLPNAVTLPQHFTAHGYRALGAGKVFDTSFPDPVSWEEYFPSSRVITCDSPLPPNRPVSGIPHHDLNFDWGPVDVVDKEMADGMSAHWAAEELLKPSVKPFFMGIGIVRPHLPFYVPPRYFDLYPPNAITLPVINGQDLDDVPPVGVEFAMAGGRYQKIIQYQQLPNAVAGYLASVSFADAQVGLILDALDRSPYAENTVIVLWGDNGYHLGEKLHWAKSTLWEESTRCPLIIVAPGMAVPGGRCQRPVSMLDVYPTLIDTCGLTAKNELEGVSLRPLLTDPQASWNRPALTTWLYNNHSIRSERWRYIRYNDGTEELYDHDNDPLEWTNLAGNPDYALIKAEHAAWLPQTNAPPAPEQ